MNGWKIKKNEKINIKRHNARRRMVGSEVAKGTDFLFDGQTALLASRMAASVTLSQSAQEIKRVCGGALLPQKWVQRPDYIDRPPFGHTTAGCGSAIEHILTHFRFSEFRSTNFTTC